MAKKSKTANPAVTLKKLPKTVAKLIARQPVVDLHTHTYPPEFGPLNLWGIDNLLTYHYLVAEVFRWAPEIEPATFFDWSVSERADLIWQKLFVEHSPVSEACRGVLTVLQNLGIDTEKRSLKAIRKAFANLTSKKKGGLEAYVDRIFSVAGVSEVVMTNDPFESVERGYWDKGAPFDSRYKAALRIDPLLNDWPTAREALFEQGFQPEGSLTQRSVDEVRRFLDSWADRMQPLYCAVSLPPEFRYPEESHRGEMIEKCIVPFARDRNIPFAMMIGVKKLLNPELGLAGDGVGKSEIRAVENLCLAFPKNRFMVTFLSRENQHELCVCARKFANLLPFGCWWFMNVPSIIEEMTRERLELVGLSIAPQHSDARVLDQLIYKWPHSRRVIGDALTKQYEHILNAGWTLTRNDIKRDIADLLSQNFLRFARGADR